MNDQISRQKLIEELKKEILQICKNCKSDRYHAGMIAGIERVIEKIKSQPPADQWIPCSSGRMPEHKQQAYITVKIAENRRYTTKANYYTETGIVYEDEWTGEGFYSYDSEYGWGRHHDVIAWMPAEPYKGE